MPPDFTPSGTKPNDVIADTSSMTDLAHIMVEVDKDRGILHLTADDIVRILDEDGLNELCHKVSGVLQELPDDRKYYLMVNISKLVIVPELAKAYSERVDFLCQNFLCANGLVRYGHQITRVTARLGHEKYLHNNAHIFGTRQEAEAYLQGLIEGQKVGALDATE